ncbi:MAG: hypothetical protein QXG00_02610 [Candidatus Woesearchaeota archaeon]
MNKIKIINKKGFAIVWSLILSLIILIMASSMAVLIIKELRITANIDESNRAYMAAESGMERALFYIKNQGFGWCPPGVINYGPITIDTNLVYRYKITVVGNLTGCDSITVESTGTENNLTHRKIKLSIVYNSTDPGKIGRFDNEPLWTDPSKKYYPFPASSNAADKPLIVQQFDLWDLNGMASNSEIFVGMNLNSSRDFGVKIKKISGDSAKSTFSISIYGKLNVNMFTSSTPQYFLSESDDKFRIVTEFSRASGGYSILRSIVLKNISKGSDERFACPDNLKSYVVYSTLNETSINPVNVAVSTTSVSSPYWEKNLGNGYLVYPGEAKLDNMVFWGRE